MSYEANELHDSNVFDNSLGIICCVRKNIPIYILRHRSDTRLCVSEGKIGVIKPLKLSFYIQITSYVAFAVA